MSSHLCNRLRKRLLPVVAPLLAFACINAPAAWAGTIFSVPATSCAAINPNQSLRLNWGKEGVVSHDDAVTLWVMCPLVREAGLDDGSDLSYFSAAVTVFAESDADLNSDVRCILREWISGVEQHREDDQVTLLRENEHTFRWMNLQPTDVDLSMYNVACRLDVETGVRSLYTESHSASGAALDDALDAAGF